MLFDEKIIDPILKNLEEINKQLTKINETLEKIFSPIKESFETYSFFDFYERLFEFSESFDKIAKYYDDILRKEKRKIVSIDTEKVIDTLERLLEKFEFLESRRLLKAELLEIADILSSKVILTETLLPALPPPDKKVLNKIIDTILRISDKIIDSFKGIIFKLIESPFFVKVRNYLKELIKPLNLLLNFSKKFATTFKETMFRTTSVLAKTISDVSNKIINYLNKILPESIKKVLISINKFFKSLTGLFLKLFRFITKIPYHIFSVIQNAITFLKNIFIQIKKFPQLIKKIKSFFKKFFNKISNAFKKISERLSKISKAIFGSVDFVIGFLIGFFHKEIVSFLAEVIDVMKKIWVVVNKLLGFFGLRRAAPFMIGGMAILGLISPRALFSLIKFIVKFAFRIAKFAFLRALPFLKAKILPFAVRIATDLFKFLRIGPMFRAVGGAIVRVLPIIGRLSGIIGAVIGSITIVSDIIKGLQTRIEGIGRGFTAFAYALGGTGKGIMNAINNALRWGAIGLAVGSVIPGIGTAIGGLIGGLLGFVLGLVGGENIARGLQTVFNAVKSVFKSIAKGISSIINFFRNIIEKISFDRFKIAVQYGLLGMAVGSVLPGIGTLIGGLIGFIYGFITNKPLPIDIFEGIKKALSLLKSIGENIVNFFKKLGENIIASIPKLWSIIKGIGKWLIKIPLLIFGFFKSVGGIFGKIFSFFRKRVSIRFGIQEEIGKLKDKTVESLEAESKIEVSKISKNLFLKLRKKIISIFELLDFGFLKLSKVISRELNYLILKVRTIFSRLSEKSDFDTRFLRIIKSPLEGIIRFDRVDTRRFIPEIYTLKPQLKVVSEVQMPEESFDALNENIVSEINLLIEIRDLLNEIKSFLEKQTNIMEEPAVEIKQIRL